MDRNEMVKSLDNEIRTLTSARDALAGESKTGSGRARAASGEAGKRGPGRPKGSTNAGSNGNPRGGVRAGAGRPRGSGRDASEASAPTAE